MIERVHVNFTVLGKSISVLENLVKLFLKKGMNPDYGLHHAIQGKINYSGLQCEMWWP